MRWWRFLDLVSNQIISGKVKKSSEKLETFAWRTIERSGARGDFNARAPTASHRVVIALLVIRFLLSWLKNSSTSLRLFYSNEIRFVMILCVLSTLKNLKVILNLTERIAMEFTKNHSAVRTYQLRVGAFQGAGPLIRDSSWRWRSRCCCSPVGVRMDHTISVPWLEM